MSEEKPRRYTDRVLEWVSRRSALLFALVIVAGLVGSVLLVRLIVQASAGPPTPQVTPAPAPPALSVEPSEARSGDEITVVGFGWKPGETVLIRLEDAQAGSDIQAYVASAVVTESGSFVIAFRVPANEPWAGLSCIRVEAYAPGRGLEAAAELRIVDELAPSPQPTDTAVPTQTPAPSASPEVPPTSTPIPDVESWRGEYFASPDLGGPARSGPPVLVRYDREINFYWGHDAPDAALPADSFSVRWQRTLPMEAGAYRFFVRVDDGVRVWVDDELIIDQWKLNPAVTYSAQHTLEAGSHTIRVEYFEDHEAALIQFWWVREGEFPQWRGAYYNNVDLIGAPAVVRNDAAIDFDWGRGTPADAVGMDGFAVRWTREMRFDAGIYRFRAVADDGVRVFVDNVLVIDAWEVGSAREVTGERNLSAGNHFLRVEYFEHSGEARIGVGWEKASGAVFPDWRGEYWANPALSGDPVIVRNDEAIDFNWGAGSPDSVLPANGFSVRWTRTAPFDDAIYRFNALVDDGVRVWLDGRLIIDTWREGSARHVRQEVAVAPGPHAIRVEYYEGRGDAQIRVWWEKVSAASYPDWRGAYWANRSLSGDPLLVRNDETITFNWDAGAPHPSLPSDDFSARWTRTASFDAATVRFHVYVDDGVRLWLDDQLVINAWEDGAAREVTADYLVARGEHTVKVEYYEHTGQASIRVWWEKVPDPAFTEWRGEYFSNNDLSGGPVLVRNDAEVKFNWGMAAPAQGLPADDFSVRWTRWVTFENGLYLFQARADDGIRFWIDDELVIDRWQISNGTQAHMAERKLSGRHQLMVDYFEHTQNALIDFSWKQVLPTATPPTQPTATATSTPTRTPEATSTPTDTPEPTSTLTDSLSGGATLTPTLTLTPLPEGPVVINELLSAPAADWNEDGTMDEGDQWIELRNVTTATVDLSGWFLVGADEQGVAFKVPTDTVLAEGEYWVVYRAESGIGLESEDEEAEDWNGVVRLLGPDGALVDEASYGELPADASASRDEAGEWRTDWPPSPNAPNAAAAPSLRIAPKLPDLPTLLRDKLREWFRR